MMDGTNLRLNLVWQSTNVDFGNCSTYGSEILRACRNCAVKVSSREGEKLKLRKRMNNVGQDVAERRAAKVSRCSLRAFFRR